jgi:hypothetical protein
MPGNQTSPSRMPGFTAAGATVRSPVSPLGWPVIGSLGLWGQANPQLCELACDACLGGHQAACVLCGPCIVATAAPRRHAPSASWSVGPIRRSTWSRTRTR